MNLPEFLDVSDVVSLSARAIVTTITKTMSKNDLGFFGTENAIV